MRGEDHAVASGGERLDALHDAEAVAVVQTRRRLVHDERVRVLHERAAQQHQLPLAAGDARAAALGQLRDAELRKDLHRAHRLRARGPVKGAELRAQAHQDALEHRMVEDRVVRLRDIGQLRRQRAAGIRPHVAPGDLHAAALRLQKAEQAAEQRAFSHAVRAEHGDALALVRAEADALQHVRAAVGEDKVLHVNLHHAASLL